MVVTNNYLDILVVSNCPHHERQRDTWHGSQETDSVILLNMKASASKYMLKCSRLR